MRKRERERARARVHARTCVHVNARRHFSRSLHSRSFAGAVFMIVVVVVAVVSFCRSLRTLISGVIDCMRQYDRKRAFFPPVASFLLMFNEQSLLRIEHVDFLKMLDRLQLVLTKKKNSRLAHRTQVCVCLFVNS